MGMTHEAPRGQGDDTPMKKPKNPHPTSLEEQLGGDILHTLADLISDPSLIESLRLFTGSDVKPITLLQRQTPDACEEYQIDTDGQLIYTKKETSWNPQQPENTTKITLNKTQDFNDLPLDSLSELHQIITREDFLDRLTWKMGRIGKPGYTPNGYDEEQNTWRIKSADPDDPTTLNRRSRTQRRHESPSEESDTTPYDSTWGMSEA